MLQSWLAFMRGSVCLILIIVSVCFWFIPILFLGFFKLLSNNVSYLNVIRKLILMCGFRWIALNNLLIDKMIGAKLVIEGQDQLRADQSYLLISNHQSWVDILVLQYAAYKHIPFLKFFLKQELIWIPLLGFCWWALEFPFMKRYSSAYLAKHPEKKGKDFEATRLACERYKLNPVTVVNFVEGTRFTQSKHDGQSSPFIHLLKPKAGGSAAALQVMGAQFESVIDATIFYPNGAPTLWQFLCGDVPKIVLKLKKIEIPHEFIGKDYASDQAFRTGIQTWLNDMWQEKDKTLSTLKDKI